MGCVCANLQTSVFVSHAAEAVKSHCFDKYIEGSVGTASAGKLEKVVDAEARIFPDTMVAGDFVRCRRRDFDKLHVDPKIC